MKLKDSRIKLTSEVLNGIEVLKLYGWENSFGDRIQAIRNSEVEILQTMAFLEAGSALSWFMAPYMVLLIMVVCNTVQCLILIYCLPLAVLLIMVVCNNVQWLIFISCLPLELLLLFFLN